MFWLVAPLLCVKSAWPMTSVAPANVITAIVDTVALPFASVAWAFMVWLPFDNDDVANVHVE